MDDETKRIFQESVKEATTQMVLEGKAKIQLDHKALREVLGTDLDFIDEIKANILRTSLKGHMIKSLGGETQKMLKEIVSTEMKKYFSKPYTYKSERRLTDSLRLQIKNAVEENMKTEVNSTIRDSVGAAMGDINEFIDGRVEAYFNSIGEKKLKKIISDKLNAIYKAMIPWKIGE